MTVAIAPQHLRYLLLPVFAVLAACGPAGGPPEFPPPDVSVALPLQKSISQWGDYSGRVEAVDAVEIRARVGGYLNRVHFSEGGIVAAGDLLFSIDDREYRAALASAQADLARAQSRLALAKKELQRSETLRRDQAVSQGELEARRGERQQADADLLGARARVQQAELTLSFTRIRAPIAGRIGAALIKPGNLLAPDQSLLTTLVSLDPVYVAFDADEQAFLRNRQSGAERSVQVGLANETGYPHQGQLVFLDNVLDPATGTVRARATLANPDGLFVPGLFARVRLLDAVRDDVLLIHEQAVQTDQDHRYVYVLGEGNTAQRRDVVLGPASDGLRVVESGLDRDTRVVVNGARKIFFPGQPVAPREVPMTEPEQAPPAPPQAAAGPG